jgi:hypothetical protein
MRRDTILIYSFGFLLGACFFFVYVVITKTLPTGPGYLSLGKKGMIITLVIHGLIILLCTITLVFRVTFINNFIHNGIKTVACIQDVIKEKKKLRFFYTYKIGGEVFFDSAEIHVKKEYTDFITGAKVLIFVDPDDFRKSLFVQVNAETHVGEQ